MVRPLADTKQAIRQANAYSPKQAAIRQSTSVGNLGITLCLSKPGDGYISTWKPLDER